MTIGIPELPKPRLVPVLLAIVAVQFILLGLRIHLEPAPGIDTGFAGASVALSADRAWTIRPGQCASVRWQLEGIASVYVNHEGKVGQDEMAFCPTPSNRNLIFEITSASGETRSFRFIIQSLPAAIQIWLVFLALLSPFLVAGYYLATLRLERRSISDPSPFLLLAAILLLGLLIQTAQPDFIAGVLDHTSELFKSLSWQRLGLVLAVLVYAPLAFQALRRGRQRGLTSELAAAGAFFLVALLLFAPAGFESIGQWEIWTNQSFLEGRPAKLEHELIVRFWILVPHVAAMAISPDSFAGYHLVNLFLFWAMMVAFYAIMRQLGAPPWLAFLAAILFLVYPVNSRLMSIRSIGMTFGKLSLLAAVFLILECRENPSRLRLLGVWLALLFNVGTYETALVIVLVIPLLWWWREPRRLWRNINLTAIWYLVPIAKAAHILLMLLEDRFFYGSWFISGSQASGLVTLDKFGEYVDRVGSVYRRAFIDGWGEALAALGQNESIALTAITLALVGAVAAWLARRAEAERQFPPRRSILGAMLAGFLFILPSIGVLMWTKHAGDLWRMYVYVPIGAAIFVMGLVVLVSAPVKSARLRQAFVIGLALLLIWPGLSRLYAQQHQLNLNANAKAGILRQIVEQAPEFQDDAHLILFTTLSADALEALGVRELRYNMFNGAMHMLYQDRRPLVSFMCIYDLGCSRDDNYLQYVDRDFLSADETYSDVVMFQLHADLRAELLFELPPELRERERNHYDPQRLIDVAAPPPARARSLLASVWPN